MNLPRFGVAFLALTGLLLTGCAEPAPPDYLEPAQGRKAVKRVTDAAEDRAVRVDLGRREVTVQVVEKKITQQWSQLEGYRDPEQFGIRHDLSPAMNPFRPSELDYETLAARLDESGTAKNCTERGLHIEALATRTDPNYRLYCLDTSVHVWLNPDLAPYQQGIDIRSAEGLQTALTDLQRVAGSDRVHNFAIQYGGSGDRVSVEVPGECGNAVDCPAFELSRTPRIDRDPPISTAAVTPRLNYVVPLGFDAVQPAALYEVIHDFRLEHGISDTARLTVTVYQVGEQPRVEFAWGAANVAYTDLAGRSLA